MTRNNNVKAAKCNGNAYNAHRAVRCTVLYGCCRSSPLIQARSGYLCPLTNP